MRRPLALACAALVAACASSTEPKVSREETRMVTLRARVEAVDPATRVVTLVDGAGNRTRFRADEAVRNLPQVEPGDEVVGELVESIAVEVRKATEEELAAPGSVTELAATAEPGEKPAGLWVRQAQAVFVIESIDRERGGGTLRDATGRSRFVTVRDPAVLDRVKVGDDVIVTVSEALRLEVVAP